MERGNKGGEVEDPDKNLHAGSSTLLKESNSNFFFEFQMPRFKLMIR